MLFDLLNSINHWHWLAFGLLLLATELLGTAGYFLWLGISALIVGVILALLPLSWQMQWIAFGSFCLITTWLWWRKQFSQDKKDDQLRDLNQKQKQMIGQTAILEQDMIAGNTRLKVADTTWAAQCDQDLKAGTQVKIVGFNGIILLIEPI
ncbi:hypothetical protein BCU68_02185 [Vibrio sp. 10N.286.49.B3]|uniref:NfeD family protein n=1 Tax=Vibrio sp. 10N.286.49.B3 TaxID=1880855 RepID=UPI000C83B5A8|nr:NfeD family protein [Vibrio sp. 10N.286.49.B3]PMH46871.1 hypothetical protein BCU68_02185 [Vibrio sp. 10N.286.49.B3]